MKRIILMLLVFTCSRISFGADTISEIKSLAKEQVESRLLKDDHPIRYYSNILILLQGFPTQNDSLIFKELIDTLNISIDKWEVALISEGTSNLTVEINLPHTGEWKNFFHQNKNQHEIIKSTVYLDLPDSLSLISRKKIIYYNVLRALVTFNTNQNKATPLSGSVFTETKAENITFHPVDFEIIRELYSSKYEDEAIRNRSIKNEYWFSFIKLGELIAIILALVYLIFLSQKGIFIKHNFEFGEYLKQGILAFCSLFIFIAIYLTLNLVIIVPNIQMKGLAFLILSIFFWGLFH